MDKLTEQNNQVNLHPFDDEALKAEMERRGWVVTLPRSSWLCQFGKHIWSRWSVPEIIVTSGIRFIRQSRTCHRCGKVEEVTC